MFVRDVVFLIVHNKTCFCKYFCENCRFLEEHTIPSLPFCAKKLTRKSQNEKCPHTR